MKNYKFVTMMTWFFLMTSVLLLIYTYYRAEVVLQGARDAMYLKYYLIFLVGIFFFGGVLWLQKEIQAYIITLVISALVGLYLVEVGLTFFGLGQTDIRNLRIQAAAETFVEFDQDTKLEVLENLASQGVNAVPEIFPRDLLDMYEEFLPLSGVSFKTTVGPNETGRRMIYQSDRYGFNNPDFEWDVERVEWLLIGDSFAEGMAVMQGQDIAGQLRDISQLSAINLGRAGNGPLIELATMTEYAGAVKPRKILWLFYEGNDLTRNLPIEKENPLLMRYMQDGFSQNLVNRQKEIDDKLSKYLLEAHSHAQSQERLYKTRWIRLHGIRKLIGSFNNSDSNTNTNSQIDYPLFIKILTKAKANAEAWGGKLYFVYLPKYSRYSEKVIAHDNYYNKSNVIEIVKKLNLPVIDIHQEVFSDHPDPLSLFPFSLSGHYNSDGYREVAKAIIKNIQKY